MRIPRLLSLFAVTALLAVGCSDELTPSSPSLDAEIALGKSGPVDCETKKNDSVETLLPCVTLDGVRRHQAALQDIADANGGTRVSGSAGYDMSAAYVADQMAAAGYQVTLQEFEFSGFVSLSPSVLERTAPTPVGPVNHAILTYSGSGDVTASVANVPSDGCDAADFAGFPVGNVALILRGTCNFSVKAENAYNAGASAVVIRNDRETTLNWTLGIDFTPDIPVVGVSLTDGENLAVTPGLVLRVKTQVSRGPFTTANVIAESVDGDPDNVVVVGAHLDAVTAGPGIQDNGSGSAAILETAIQMANVKPKNKLRFAWWGAEEFGLIGSGYYVNNLSAAEVEAISLYLNFDMIGSPNHVYFIYDGDDSDGVGVGPLPDGSGIIEEVFEQYYAARGIPFKGSDPGGRSDYFAFINAGIPAGGLFTGAEGVKTAEEVVLWGGTEGDQYDPCYHLACDTFDNISLEALEVNADAVAYATVQFAMNKKIEKATKVKNKYTASHTHELASE